MPWRYPSLAQGIATTRDAAGAVKALKNVPQSKKAVREFKVLWDKMQEEKSLFEQVLSCEISPD
jgi:hypothetical protein